MKGDFLPYSQNDYEYYDNFPKMFETNNES